MPQDGRQPGKEVVGVSCGVDLFPGALLGPDADVPHLVWFGLQLVRKRVVEKHDAYLWFTEGSLKYFSFSTLFLFLRVQMK